MNEQQYLNTAVEAGLKLFAEHGESMPYSDGLFFLHRFLHQLAKGELLVTPVQPSPPQPAPQPEQAPEQSSD